MNEPVVIVMDETALRRILAEEIARQLDPVRDSLSRLTPTNIPDESPLSASDLAAMLGVSKRTLRRMLLAGDLPAPVRASQRATWWSRGIVTNWIETGRIQVRPPLKIRARRG